MLYLQPRETASIHCGKKVGQGAVWGGCLEGMQAAESGLDVRRNRDLSIILRAFCQMIWGHGALCKHYIYRCLPISEAKVSIEFTSGDCAGQADSMRTASQAS